MPRPISWELVAPYFATALVLGYLIGSVPFGWLLTRLAGLGDIRAIGSGNIGATNVLRTGRKGLAAATLLLDAAKGAVAVLIGANWGPDIANIAGTGALLGHLFPVWLGFKGGKGVATTLGVILAIAWPVGLAACATWLVVAAALRYSSLAALAALALSPAYAWWLRGDTQLVQLFGFFAVLIWLRHYANIWRLLKGTEPKIGREA
jgi:acyl phosphate:glycerol-3-phosphate acyltransferase